MGKYFADVHASHESQFQGLPHGLADTDEILACRAKPQTYENILELADALCWQLRFWEAIDALTQAVKLEPERMEAYRKRGPKYLDTLQFELSAVALMQYLAESVEPVLSPVAPG